VKAGQKLGSSFTDPATGKDESCESGPSAGWACHCNWGCPSILWYLLEVVYEMSVSL